MEGLGAFLVLLMLAAIYLFPGIVASNRNHHQSMAIWVLNVLMGWTVLGWVMALVWACTKVVPSNTMSKST